MKSTSVAVCGLVFFLIAIDLFGSRPCDRNREVQCAFQSTDVPNRILVHVTVPHTSLSGVNEDKHYVVRGCCDRSDLQDVNKAAISVLNLLERHNPTRTLDNLRDAFVLSGFSAIEVREQNLIKTRE